MNPQELLRKINALKNGAKTDGERKAAEEAAARLIEKYDLVDIDIDEDEISFHTFKYKNTREKNLLFHIIVKVLGTDSKYWQERYKVVLKTTLHEALEIEYMFDFYRTLFEEEIDTFYKVFLFKHNLQIDSEEDEDDEPDSEVNLEEKERIMNMYRAMKDANLRQALPDNA